MQNETFLEYYGTGKRKRAIARVYLRPGSGVMKFNGRSMEDYFSVSSDRAAVVAPLTLTQTHEKFDTTVLLHGGGVSAQAEATRHGISRALVLFNAELRDKLKSAGYLTRDPRKKERKKYGQPGARKRFQYSKR